MIFDDRWDLCVTFAVSNVSHYSGNDSIALQSLVGRTECFLSRWILFIGWDKILNDAFFSSQRFFQSPEKLRNMLSSVCFTSFPVFVDRRRVSDVPLKISSG